MARGEARIKFRRLPQEGAGFFQDEGGDIARGRGLAEAGVERELGGWRNGLIWREGSHGKKARRVAGQSGKGDHADPRGDSVRRLVKECGAEEADFPKGIRVEKGEKFRGCVEGGASQSKRSSQSVIASMDGGSSRGEASISPSGLPSAPAAMRHRRAASSGVVPRPMKGSKTTSPGFENCSMK